MSTRRRALLRRTAGAAALVAATTAATTTTVVAGPVLDPAAVEPGAAARAADAPLPGRTFYVSPTGSDAASGTSPTRAWRTLARASATTLQPGDRVLLQRGGTWSGTLRVSGAGLPGDRVVVGSYGQGAAPVVTGGDCVVVEAPYTTVRDVSATQCRLSGFHLDGVGGVLDGVSTSHNQSGIVIAATSVGSVVTRSQVVDNNRMASGTPGPTDDYGAFGIEVLGNGAEISHSTFRGQVAPSDDFGRDGSAVEVYGAHGISIHDNTSVDNLTFTELGYPDTFGTRFARNDVRSSIPGSTFLVTRGDQAGFGPVYGTVAAHNSVWLTGAGSQAFWCGGICGPHVLTLRANAMEVAGPVGYAQGPSAGGFTLPGVGGGGNVWSGSSLGFTALPDDVVADPRFRSTSDLRLRPGSPAIDKVGPPEVDPDAPALPADGDGDGVPLPDAGAFEHRAAG